MAIDDLWRVSFGYSCQAQTCVNVLYLKQTTATGGSGAGEVCEYLAPIMAGVWNQAIARPFRGQATNTEVSKVSRIASDTGTAAFNWGIDGPNETPLPTVVSAIVRLRTGLAGPTRRGRIFLANVPAIWTAEGILNAGGIAGYRAFGQRLLAAFGDGGTAGGFRLGVFSRERYSLASIPFDDYWKPVTSVAVPSPISTMRSRKVGVGS